MPDENELDRLTRQFLAEVDREAQRLLNSAELAAEVVQLRPRRYRRTRGW